MLSSKIPQKDVVVSYNKITVLGLLSSLKIDIMFQNFKLWGTLNETLFQKAVILIC